MKKLREVETPLANFFASGVLCLREKLGPILWQFPPNFGWNKGRFSGFFDLLPRATAAAAKLARRDDGKVKTGAWTKTDAARPLRYPVEIRHPTFLVPEFFALLRQHNIACVFADTGGKWPYAQDLTADFVYCRFHGAEELYVSGYTLAALDWWAARIRHWRQGKQRRDAKLISERKPKPACARSSFTSITTQRCMRLSMRSHSPVNSASRLYLFPRANNLLCGKTLDHGTG